MVLAGRIQTAAVVALLAVSAGRSSAAGPAGATAPASVTIESEHYRLMTDLDEDMAREISRRMEAIWAEYYRRLSEFRPKRDRSDIRIYRRQADYQQYVGKDLAWSGGIYLSGRQTLATYAEGKSFQTLMTNLKHEGFHQFLAMTIPVEVPAWVNEGLAQYFEDAAWTGERFDPGDVPPWRLHGLKEAVRAGKVLPLGKLFALDSNGWSRMMSDRAFGPYLYNQAWSVVHFLVHANDGRYRKNLLAYLRELDRKADPANAFIRSFGSAERLSGEWTEYVAGLAPTARWGDIQRLSYLGQVLVRLGEGGRSVKSLDELHARLRSRRLAASGPDDSDSQPRAWQRWWERYIDSVFVSPSDPRLASTGRDGPTSRPDRLPISYVLEEPAPWADPQAPTIRCANHKEFDLVTRYRRVGKQWVIVDVIQTDKKR